MGFALPSGVVNTDSAYLYPDATEELGVVVKETTDQTLVIIDYSKLSPAFVLDSYDLSVDVTSNPMLTISYVQVDSSGSFLTFLLAGGIVGQQYNLSITANPAAGSPRVDMLTVNIPSNSGVINPVPSVYNQIPLGVQGYVNTAVRYFYGNRNPTNPGVMDQWFDTASGTLSEWTTDGHTFFWQTLASPDLVMDAPVDSSMYSRYNGYWVRNPVQTDAPANGQLYSRSNNGWVRNVMQADAPSDGQIYGRNDGVWVPVPVSPVTTDAPADSQFYCRRNGSWAMLPPPVIVSDAPVNNFAYVRTNNGWSSGGVFNASLLTQGNLGAGGSLSVGGNALIMGVTTFGAQVALPYDPIQNLQAATKQYVDNSIINAFNVNGSPFLRLVGGTMQGPIVLPADPVATMEAATKQYVDAHTAGGLIDAPADGSSYGRLNHTWTGVLPLTGGTLTGALILNANPTVGLGAATKQYVDAQIIAVIPSPSGSAPPMNGVAAPGVSAAYARADHVHPTDTSLYPTSNPAGYQTAAQIAAALANYYPTSNPAGYQTAAQVSAALAPYALNSSIPGSSSAAPIMDGVAAPGSATAWSRGDHVHPTDTTRYAASNPAGYQTAAQVTAALPVASSTMPSMDGVAAVGTGTTWARADHVHPSDTNLNLDMGTF
jgi:hypothetical protein